MFKMLPSLSILVTFANSSSLPNPREQQHSRKRRLDSEEEDESVNLNPKRSRMALSDSITFHIADDFALCKPDLVEHPDLDLLIGNDTPISYYSDDDRTLQMCMEFARDALKARPDQTASLKRFIRDLSSHFSSMNDSRMLAEAAFLMQSNKISVTLKEVNDVINGDEEPTENGSNMVTDLAFALWTATTRHTLQSKRQVVLERYEGSTTPLGHEGGTTRFALNQLRTILYLYNKERGMSWRIEKIFTLWKDVFSGDGNQFTKLSLWHNTRSLWYDYENADALIIELGIVQAIQQWKASGKNGSVAVLVKEAPSNKLMEELRRLGFETDERSCV